MDQKSSKRKVKQDARNFLLIAHKKEMVHLILPLINKNNLEEELNTISYEEFVLKAVDKISNTVYSTLYDIKNTPIIIEKEYKHYLTKDVIHDIVDSFLVASPECSKVLEECFNDKIRKDIMEIEQTEKDHVELLKQFGEEPTGDPELHDKENNTESPVESDSEYRLNEIQEILFKLNRLKRKYGPSISTIKEAKKEIEMKIATFNNRERFLNDLKKQLSIAFQEAKELADAITELRKQEAQKFTDAVTNELKSLYLDKVVFKIDFKKIDLQANGQDKVEFLISTNAGQTLKPLNKVASGGEMSRIMLAIKILSLKSSSIETIIFDEADTGVSGKVAESIGAKMKKIAKDHQVLCITHLAQVAAFAKNHYLIKKVANDNDTNVSITKLNYDESIMEIAKLISGKEVSHESIEHARKLKENSE